MDFRINFLIFFELSLMRVSEFSLVTKMIVHAQKIVKKVYILGF